jgi:4-hydroxybutyryl-CoA dehydratase/vinylacetyl-CoA-Delta-isomerase
MALKTGAEYLDSIESYGLEAHILGQKTGDRPEHGLVQPSRQAVAFTYDCACNPETRDLFCVEMIQLNETIYACGLACSATGEKTPAGNYQVNLLLANVCKLNVTRFPFELARLATDIAGGLLGTMPSAADLEDPVTGPYIQKYLAASPDSRVVDRMKVLRLIENLVAGAGAVGYLIESMHGAGPPMAQRIMIGRQADLDGKIARVEHLLGIK